MDFMALTNLKGGVLFAMMTSFALPLLKVFRVCLYPKTYLPLFITGASLELMFSRVFFCKRYTRPGFRSLKCLLDHKQNCLKIFLPFSSEQPFWNSDFTKSRSGPFDNNKISAAINHAKTGKRKWLIFSSDF